MNDKDDDIEIDFSKIKNLFKRKKNSESDAGEQKEAPQEPEAMDEKEKDVEDIQNGFKKKGNEKKDEDEISIDFSKVKGFFKGLKGKEKAEAGKASEDEISIDVKGLAKTLYDKRAWLLPIVIITIAMVLAFQARISPKYIPQADGWAFNAIENFNRQLVSSQINQQYPNLPGPNRDKLVGAELGKLFSNNEAYWQTGQGIQKVPLDLLRSELGKGYRTQLEDPDGRTYMPDIDPYYWMRYAQNILDHGHPGDELKDNMPYDNHMLAPNGRLIDKTDMFHPYMLAYFYKISRMFTNLPLKDTIGYYSIVVSMLCVIPAFFIGRRIAGYVGGLFAAVMLAVNQAFITRTLWGHADSDAWTIFFPLFIAWLFLESFETEKKMLKYLCIVAAGFLVGLYSITWGGWWYIFLFVLASCGIYILYYGFLYRKELRKGLVNYLSQPGLKNVFIFVAVFILSSGLFTTLFHSFQTFIDGFIGPLRFTTIKAPVLETLWPNVLTTVAELNPGHFGSTLGSVGGKLFFYIGVLGIILTLFKKDEHGKVNIRHAVFLTLWFVSSIYAVFKGVRFTLLLAPAYSIAFGSAIGILYFYFTKWISKGLHINKILTQVMLFALFGMLLLNPINAAKGIGNSDLPIINDAWYNALTKIKAESKPDAIVNSWWDFGHHFKWFTDRAVTFDGTTQDTPQAHWIGKSLLTDDESQAVGIIRMLDCGGNNAYDELYSINKNPHKSIKILYSIFKLSKNDTKNRLIKEYKLSDEQADTVLKLTHCIPPENYFITSEDMIGKSGVWGHFGSWNFDRADIWFNVRKMDLDKAVSYMQENFNYSKEDAEQIYFEASQIASQPDADSQANTWVSPWPGYVSGPDSCQKIKDDAIGCVAYANNQQLPVVVNLTTWEAYIDTQDGRKHPNVLMYAAKDGFKIKEFNDTFGLGMTIYPEGDGYRAFFASSEQSTSMFARLFYMEGHGLRHFKKFADETSVFGNRIIVWKIDWNGSEINQLDAFKPKPVEKPKAQEAKEINTTDSSKASNETA